MAAIHTCDLGTSPMILIRHAAGVACLIGAPGAAHAGR